MATLYYESDADHLAAEDVDQLNDLGALGGPDVHRDEEQLALHRFGR